MIGRIHIELDKSEQEAVDFLKKSKVVLKHKLPFSGTVQNTATWKNLDNPKKFKFILESFGPIRPWWGLCSLTPSKSEGKTVLTIWIFPPWVFLFLGGIILLFVAYSIVSFGIHNYGTVGFWPSIIVPTFCIGVLLLFWGFIGRLNANKIKKGILESFEEWEG